MDRELGIRRNLLYKWKNQLTEKGETAFPGHGPPVGDKEAEIAGLERGLERLTEECDVLRRAVTYFAKESG